MGTREATEYGSFITEKFLREISFIKKVPIGGQNYVVFKVVFDWIWLK